MVQTVKFSQFDNVDLTNPGNKVVGVGGGLNFQQSDVITWTTATRPAPAYNGLSGYNTDISKYEYYDSTQAAWVQFAVDNVPVPLTWNLITATSASMLSGNGYVTNNVSRVVLTLPLTCAFGTSIAVSGLGSGGWQIVFNMGQSVVLGNVVATASSGNLASTNQFDQIELLCVVANTTFIARNVIGNITIV